MTLADRLAMALITTNGVDVAHPQTRQQLDDMVASGLLTAERSNAIKALAERVRYSSWAEHHNIVVTARTVGLARGARE